MASDDVMRSVDRPEGPSKLFFTYDDVCTHAVLAKSVSTGLLVCIPSKALEEEVFTSAEAAEYNGLIGPYSFTSVPALAAQGRKSKRFLEVVLFDLDISGQDLLSLEVPLGVDAASVVTFGDYRGVVDWPHPGGIAEVATQLVASGGDRLDQYFTAAEEVPNGGEVSDGPPEMMGLLHQLVARSEATQQAMLEMQGQVGLIGDLSARLKSLENKQALGGIQPPSQAAAASPQLFQPSVGALDQGRRDRLQALAGRGPSRVKDLGATSQSVAAPLPPVQGGTIGDDEEEEADPLHQLDARTGVLEQLLVSQTALLSKLAASKVAQHDPLAMLVSPQESEEGVKHTGVKGIAARHMLIDSFKKHPDKVYKIFRERLSLARRRPSVSSLESRDLWLHMQETVPLGTHRTLTYMGFQAAAMFEAAERGEIDRLKMLVALQAIFVEQAAYDSGSLRIAHLLTCLEDPPFAQTESHRVAKVDFAHSQLSDPRWLAAQLGYLKDVESLTEKTSKFTKGLPSSSAGDDNPSVAAPKPKAKWKPKRKGPQEQQEGE